MTPLNGAGESAYGRAMPHRIGMDLSKVTFPTFVLEPRSMLERITDFMSHPELIFGSVSWGTASAIYTA
jgi:hypothetical protein